MQILAREQWRREQLMQILAVSRVGEGKACKLLPVSSVRENKSCKFLRANSGCCYKLGPEIHLPMMFPQLARFTDVALFLLRVMIGIVFIASGWNHLKEPGARSKDIGMSKGFTIFLGAAEVAGGLGVVFGVLTQLAASGLILIMLGAIQKKIFVWHTGFWGESGTNGWSYDTMLVIMNLVIVTTGGGNLALLK